MGMEKIKWNFHSLDQLHYAVNSTLRYAMQNERCKRWAKVIETYNLLLWMIDLKNLPDSYEPPALYNMLMYETLYHIGVAYQHLGDHKGALEAYTNAINTVSIPKNGCLAGCVTNSCLMTPLYARRAFASVRTGDMKNAMKDAEKAVVLDSKNPDVYCIRALTKSSNDDEGAAVKDVELALKLQNGHLCSLMLRSALTRPKAGDLKAVKMTRMDSGKADSGSCSTVSTFRHSCIMEFYDKYLFTLCVPHTIVQIDLTPDKPNKKQLAESQKEPGNDSLKQRPMSAPDRISVEPFKCGTPCTEFNKMATRRRKDYGEAIRKYICRPKTASAFFEQLERERRKQADVSEMERRRAVSAGVKRLNETALVSGTAHAESHAKLNKRYNSAPIIRQTMKNVNSTSASIKNLQNAMPPKPPKQQNGKENKENIPHTSAGNGVGESDVRRHKSVSIKEKADRSKRIPSSTKFTFPTPVNYSTPVFQPLNIRDAPRMYYKPWKGDKLPVAEVDRHVIAPCWK
ncbi:uncharacterized protein LOC125653578 isoform X2 [Ostrea edulis]|uniref:uncharacterized protein LOC125653578 isoform X2 n=1 Tax=Ostrea edulis TaxID=37623 RepID=UPI002096024D|nr:uncharacterized protein LOC125653578 isoform X2 [Ostrea edulis]